MEFSPAPPATSVGGLPQPPSAKSSRTYGILGICSHLLCLLGAPFAILFGILALVRHGRAKREHAADPRSFAPPAATGLVTGIVALALLVVALPMTGIVSAIAIPALLGQRERARNLAMDVIIRRAEEGVLREALQLPPTPRDQPGRSEALVRALLAHRELQYPQAKNPYGGAESPYRLGSAPAALGEVTLEPVEGAMEPGGSAKASVVLRWKVQRRGQVVGASKVIELD